MSFLLIQGQKDFFKPKWFVLSEKAHKSFRFFHISLFWLSFASWVSDHSWNVWLNSIMRPTLSNQWKCLGAGEWDVWVAEGTGVVMEPSEECSFVSVFLCGWNLCAAELFVALHFDCALSLHLWNLVLFFFSGLLFWGIPPSPPYLSCIIFMPAASCWWTQGRKERLQNKWDTDERIQNELNLKVFPMHIPSENTARNRRVSVVLCGWNLCPTEASHLIWSGHQD